MHCNCWRWRGLAIPAGLRFVAVAVGKEFVWGIVANLQWKRMVDDLLRLRVLAEAARPPRQPLLRPPRHRTGRHRRLRLRRDREWDQHAKKGDHGSSRRNNGDGPATGTEEEELVTKTMTVEFGRRYVLGKELVRAHHRCPLEGLAAWLVVLARTVSEERPPSPSAPEARNPMTAMPMVSASGTSTGLKSRNTGVATASPTPRCPPAPAAARPAGTASPSSAPATPAGPSPAACPSGRARAAAALRRGGCRTARRAAERRGSRAGRERECGWIQSAWREREPVFRRPKRFRPVFSVRD
ncbi:hypothetical protein ZWY2020_057174 [Hordeum vulgare]|nr:hypothetical protein ZWY2020_057174 [Hordeum vulgare]